MTNLNLVVSENMMYTINCINRLHENAGSEYSIQIQDFETLDDLKTECKIIVNELWHEGFLGKNWDMRNFLIDMLN